MGLMTIGMKDRVLRSDSEGDLGFGFCCVSHS